jgi:hypothetical protein
MGRACNTNGERITAYRTFVEKSEENKLVQRSRRRWLDNIKMDLRETGLDGRDLFDLAQNRDRWRALVNTVMNPRVP